MITSLKKIRSSKFEMQNGLCFYCKLPMWNESVEQFAKFHSITLAQAKQLQCTAEHLRARCDGGRDSQSNIVAACIHCNKLRHKRPEPLDHEKYKKLVMKRISKKKWHHHQIIALLEKNR